MAKTRAQRKAEKRRRQAQLEREGGAGGGERAAEARAQHDTQLPISGDVAEAEAVIETGARPEDYGERTVEHGDSAGASSSPVPGVIPETPSPTPQPEAPELPAPAPSRADVGTPEAPEEPRESRRERRRREKQERSRERERELQKSKAASAAAKQEKRRGGVIGFLASCWAELKKVQWPDRETLVQASAVTIVFVAVLAAYLGALDGIFNWLIKQLL